MEISIRRRILSLLIAVLMLWATFGASGHCCAETPNPAGPPVLLQMIRDDAVQKELRLNDQQKTKVLSVLRSVDGPWFRSRNLKVSARDREISKLVGLLDAQLQDFLTESQQQRLLQLRCQALGTRMLLRSDVVSKLELTKQQVETLTSAFRETDNAVSQLPKAGSSNEQNKLKQRELALVKEELTEVQERRLSDFTGAAFDFGTVRRTYPLAPELSLEDAQWIQGKPIKLNDLQGKVVAIHFYAFQCINCQRNLPHYNAWMNDYADRDFVVIGIQTPETAAERNRDQVASAAKHEGIKYPVLFDLESANWKIWSNTMWPTVYLIDRKGFLRRWWQGELNWQEGNGEQQMRTTIEQLLAEPQ